MSYLMSNASLLKKSSGTIEGLLFYGMSTFVGYLNAKSSPEKESDGTF